MIATAIHLQLCPRRRRAAFARRLSGFFATLLLLTTLLIGEPAAGAVALNAEEQKMASLLVNASGQRRDRSRMIPDARLCQVARARAMDMAKRRYFAHVNPDGKGPNYLVRQAGYPLPSHYNTSNSGNNIESIGCGYADANAAWSGWMGSAGHKTHLLATESFYRDQTTFGVGYHSEPGSPYVRYYVVLTAPPAGDLLTITAPAAGARVLSSEVTVTGQVSGSAIVGQLQYRVENTAGTGSWLNGPVPSTEGIGNWSARVAGLRLGGNTIRVRTLDASGAVLKEVARSVRLAVMKPLIVEVSGEGQVTPGFLGTTQREVGLRYTINAIAKPGYILDFWEGLPEGPNRDVRKRAQTFVMAEGLVLRAHFAPNPFLGLNGKYQGLVMDGSANHETTGALRLMLTANGGFSGQLIMGPSRFPVRGTLNSAGTATVTVPRPGQPNLTLTLQLDLANSSGLLSATLSDGTTNWSLQASRHLPVEPGTVQPPRRFTFRLAPDETVPASPQGFGFGTATVNAANVVKFAGQTADGRTFTSSATLSADGRVALYAPLFAGSGALAGTLQLDDQALGGSVRWFKPERPLQLRYPGEFSTTNQLVGSRYIAPVVGNQIAARSSAVASALHISGGDLQESLVQLLDVGADQRLTWTVATIPSLKVNLRAATGHFSGSFVRPEGGLRTFRGIFLQNEGRGCGFFLAPNETGAVTLQPVVE